MSRLLLALLGPLALGCGGGISTAVALEAGAEDGNVEATTGADAADGAGNDAPADTDGASCVILASSYDQSCTSDTDCVIVTSANYCAPDQCFCGGSAISAGALARFRADVAKTPVGTGAIPSASCGCPAENVCCIEGICQGAFGACSSTASDTLAACADAGGTCARFVEACGGRGAGPSSSCAFADETCCLR